MRETVIYIFAFIGAGFSAFIVGIIIDAVFDLIKERMERKCELCGKSYKFGDNFCSRCGKPLGLR